MKSINNLTQWTILLMLPVVSVTAGTVAIAIRDHAAHGWIDKDPSAGQLSSSSASVTQGTSDVNSLNAPSRLAQDPQPPALPGGVPFEFEPPQVPDLTQDFDAERLPQTPLVDQPRPRVDERFAGWNGATWVEADEVTIGETLRASWVMLGENGRLQGTVQAPGRQFEPFDETALLDRSTRVYLLHGGQLVGSTRLNVDGDFIIDGVSAGTYSLIVYGLNSFAVVGFNALDYRDGPVNYPRSLEILSVDKQDFLVSDMVMQLAPEARFPVRMMYEIGEGPDDPARYYGIQGLADHDPLAVPSDSIQARPVRLLNGQMLGRLHQIDLATGRPIGVQNTSVTLIQGTEVIATTSVDRHGVFVLEGLAPGYYGLIAGGEDGFGAIGVQLVAGDASLGDASESNGLHSAGPQLVSARSSGLVAADSFDMALAPVESIGWLNHYVAQQTYLEAITSPMPDDGMGFPGFGPGPFDGMMGPGGGFGGGSGGGSGGGFGGGFGGGGFGFGLPLAIAAIVAAAVSDTDRGIPVATPFIP